MFRRFCIPVVFVVCIAVVFFLLANLNVSFGSVTMELLQKCAISLILTFFFSVGVSFAVEHTALSSRKKLLFQLIPLVFGVVFYFHLEGGFFDGSYSNGISVGIAFVGIIAFLFFAPYLTTLKIKNTLYYQYFYTLAQVFLFGFVLGGLLFGLGALAILSLKLLFAISGSLLEDLLSNWAVLSLSFIAPIICLMKLPKDTAKADTGFLLSTFETFIIKYVFTSFVFLYFVILYAYTIKVFLHFGNRPKGEVCWLVIAFSSIGYLWYLLSYYLESGLKVLSRFRVWFPIVVIPQIFMLFYAIYLRIQQYDITVDRYFVVAFGVLLLVLSLYFICSKKKNLLSLPAILMVFTLLISFGPWSIFSLPETRQMARLEANLEKAGILVDGEIVPLQEYTAIDEKLSGEIYDGIRYLCVTFDCKSLAQLFDKDVAMLTRVSKWQFVDDIVQEIRVKSYYPSVHDMTPAVLYVYVEGNIFPLDVEGYDAIVAVDSVGRYPEAVIVVDTVDTVGRYQEAEKKVSLRVSVDVERGNVQIFDGQGLQETIVVDLKTSIYEALVARYGIPVAYSNALSKEALTFELRGEKYFVRLYFQNFEMKNPAYQGRSENDSPYVNGYALIKEL